MSFIDEVERHLKLAGVTILPIFEEGKIKNSIQCTADINCTPLEFVEYLRTKIKNNQIQFISLPLPKTVLVAQLQRKGDVLIRYLEDYILMSDEKVARYDCLLRL